MKRKILEKAALDLMQIPPLLHRSSRRTMKRAEVMDLGHHVTHQQFEVLILLEDEGTLQVAAIGKKLQIAKAQMTQMMDKLSDLGLINRAVNPSDRRAINISLSPQGKTILEGNKIRFRSAVQDSISVLSDEDLEELSASLRKVQSIMGSIDQT